MQTKLKLQSASKDLEIMQLDFLMHIWPHQLILEKMQKTSTPRVKHISLWIHEPDSNKCHGNLPLNAVMLFAVSQAGAKISQNWRIFISQDESFVKQLTINSFLIFNKTPKK